MRSGLAPNLRVINLVLKTLLSLTVEAVFDSIRHFSLQLYAPSC